MGYSKRHSVLKTVWRFLTKLPIILRSWLDSNTQACYECYFKLKTIQQLTRAAFGDFLYLNLGSSEAEVAQVPQVACIQPNLYIKQRTRLPSPLIGGRRCFPACLQSCSINMSSVDLFGLIHRSWSPTNKKSRTQNPSGFHAQPSTYSTTPAQKRRWG